MNSPLTQALRMNQLLDLYGALLTSHQQRVMSWYYSMDLSLSEISARLGISRQAVRDALLRASASLEEFEAQLHLHAQGERLRQSGQACLRQLDSINHAICAVIESDESDCRSEMIQVYQALKQLAATLETCLLHEGLHGREDANGL